MRDSGWLASISLYSLSFIPLFGASSQVGLTLGCVLWAPARQGRDVLVAGLCSAVRGAAGRNTPGQGARPGRDQGRGGGRRAHWGGTRRSASLLRGLTEGNTVSCPLLRRKEKESSLQKHYTEIQNF